MTALASTILDLLDAPPDPIPAHQRHSSTSREAAEEIAPHVNRLQLKVVRAYGEVWGDGYDGLTDEEAQDRLGMNASTQRPRRIELCRMGFLRDSGRKGTTRSGRWAVIYVVTSAGRAFLAAQGETR